jgi:hypothetical protein
MPRRYHKQADFNEAEMEKIKKAQSNKTDYRFFREAVMYYVGESERRALETRDARPIQGIDERVAQLDETKLPPFFRVKVSQNP